MEITGIIAEYNPLHQGHLFHLSKTIELLHPDVLVVIVSSWFSQRGLPSLLTPADKARLILEYGADLVLELPVIYTAQSADQFARYALESLKTAGVTSLVFGSESCDLPFLESCADLLDQIEKDPKTSMARNTEQALGNLKANDILGVQYIYWCRKYGITPYCIQRSMDFISATQSRADFFAGKEVWLQEKLFKEQSWSNYYPYLRLYLQMSSPERLSHTFLCSEGLEFRLKKLAASCADWESFLNQAISRTYTRARIQRTCLFLMLQISWEQMQEHDSFFMIRLLGASQNGRNWLRQLPENTPVISRFRDLPEFLQEADLKARVLYQSVLSEPFENRVVMI